MTNRREFLKKLATLSSIGVGSFAGFDGQSAFSASLSGFRAVVAIHLAGGNDGNDVLVPLDAAFNDYTSARPSIALSKSLITPISGSYLGHSLGLNSALAPLLPIFNSGQLAFMINTGALVQPTTVTQALNGSVPLPPFLYSHPEQQEYVNGWMGSQDPSGWGGRGIEAIDPSGSFLYPLISMNSASNNLSLGQKLPLLNSFSYSTQWIGQADLLNPTNQWTQILSSLTQMQSSNKMESEYSRAFRSIYNDATKLVTADKSTPTPSGFGNDDLSNQLSMVTKLLSYFSANGATRQVYSLQWGGFDTHTQQRGTSTYNNMGQDGQLSTLANALVSFNNALSTYGLSSNVTVLVTSEFARTLDPASGLGSDHAWGNHWMVMGKPVKGGQMYGNKFPTLVKGGVDDASPQKRGYWVPQISSDQVAADLLIWLGLNPSNLGTVLPNLNNFTTKTVGFMGA